MADVVGSVVGGFIQKDASDDAAAAQTYSADQANALQRYMYDTTRADNQPRMQLGNQAANELARLIGIQDRNSFDEKAYLAANPDVASYIADPNNQNVIPSGFAHYNMYGRNEGREYKAQPSPGTPGFGSLTRQFTGQDLQTEPGYQFGMRQGQQAIDRSAASAGGLYSGATLKALQRYGQDYGGTKFNDAFNRDQSVKNSLYNMLSNVAGMGQVASNQAGAAGQNYANQVGANAIGTGNTQAANSLNQGNIWGNAVNGAVSAYGRSGGWGNKAVGNNSDSPTDWWLKHGSSGD